MSIKDDYDDDEFVANLVTCPSCGYNQPQAKACSKCKQPFVIKRVDWTVSTQTKEVKKPPVRTEEEEEADAEPSLLSKLFDRFALPSFRTVVILLIVGGIAASYSGVFDKEPVRTSKDFAKELYSHGDDAQALHSQHGSMQAFMQSEDFSVALAEEAYTHGVKAKEFQSKYTDAEEFMQSEDFDPETVELVASSTQPAKSAPKNPILMLIKGILTSDPKEVAKTNIYNPESGENPYANKLKSLGIDSKEFAESTGVEGGEIAIEDLQKTIESNPLLKKAVDDTVNSPGASTATTETDKTIEEIQ